MFGAGSDGSEFPQNSAVRSGFRWSLPLLQVPQKARWTDEYAVTAKTVLCEPFLPQGKTVAGFADRMPTHVSGLGGAAHCQPFQCRDPTVHDVLEADSHIEAEITYGRATITHGEPGCEAGGSLTGAVVDNQAESIRHQRALRLRRFFWLFADSKRFSSSSANGYRTLAASMNSHSRARKTFWSVSQPVRPA